MRNSVAVYCYVDRRGAVNAVLVCNVSVDKAKATCQITTHHLLSLEPPRPFPLKLLQQHSRVIRTLPVLLNTSD